MPDKPKPSPYDVLTPGKPDDKAAQSAGYAKDWRYAVPDVPFNRDKPTRLEYERAVERAEFFRSLYSRYLSLYEACAPKLKECEDGLAKLQKMYGDAKDNNVWYKKQDDLQRAEIARLEAEIAKLKAENAKLKAAAGPAAFHSFKARQAARAGRAGVRGGGGLYNNHDCAAEIAAAVAAAGTTFPGVVVGVEDLGSGDVWLVGSPAGTDPGAASAAAAGVVEAAGYTFTSLVVTGVWVVDPATGVWVVVL